TLFILTIPIIITNTNIYKSNKYPPYLKLENPPNLVFTHDFPQQQRGGPYPRFSLTPLKRNGCSSELGLIMATIGINQRYLAFLHICTHTFFKATLFRCSIIHSLNDEQDT
ncbi:hypothetical protein EI555_015064, partial [Monodon monoceros]